MNFHYNIIYSFTKKLNIIYILKICICYEFDLYKNKNLSCVMDWLKRVIINHNDVYNIDLQAKFNFNISNILVNENVMFKSLIV